jgi:hypothetical protein
MKTQTSTKKIAKNARHVQCNQIYKFEVAKMVALVLCLDSVLHKFSVKVIPNSRRFLLSTLERANGVFMMPALQINTSKVERV